MAVLVRADEPIDSAWRRFVRELVSNEVFEEMNTRSFHVSKSRLAADKRREYQKQKRKRSQANRKAKRNA
jgi:ribosomal protein S21